MVDAFFQKKEVFRRLCIVLGFCVIACFLNPNFVDGALYPLRVFNNYGYTIEENQTIFLLESLGFQKASVGYLKVAAALLFLFLILNFRKARVIDWLLAIIFTYAAFVAVRNLPLFVFATFIPFAKNIYDLTYNTATRVVRLYPFVKMLLVTIILFLFGWQTFVLAEKNQIGFGVASGAERGVEFFQENSLRGPIFNNFDIGSYLLYRLYPKEKVFIDGRPESYPADFIKNTYIPMQEDLEQFKKIDKKYNFQTIFFTHTDMTPWAQNFLREIVKQKGWRAVYLDETSIILLKDTKQNQKVIENFGMDYPNFKISPTATSDMTSLLKLANFFQLTDAVDLQIDVYKKILSKDPTFCPGLYNLAVLLNQKSDPAAQFFAQRYSNSCQQHVLRQN